MTEYLKRAEWHAPAASTAVRAHACRRCCCGSSARASARSARTREALDGWSPPRVRRGRRRRSAPPPAAVDEPLAEHIAFAQDAGARVRRARSARRCATSSSRPLPGRHARATGTSRSAPSARTCPGGRYPMLASAFMTVVVAKVAGVRHVDRVPRRRSAAAASTRRCCTRSPRSGADAILCLGGVQALAAMAFGLCGVEPVDMLVGAGNAFVAEAKRQLFGRVGIDLLAGPTEIAVIADETAPTPGSSRPTCSARPSTGRRRRPLLIATSALARAGRARRRRRPARALADARGRRPGVARPRRSIAVVADDAAAMRLADDVRARAPRGPRRGGQARRVRSTGCATTARCSSAPDATVAYGDKAVGTNHVLPDDGRGALHRRALGREVPQDVHVPAADAGGHARRSRPRSQRSRTPSGMAGHALTAEMRLDAIEAPTAW